MSRTQPTPPATVAQIVQEYRKGRSVSEVAEMLGLPEATAYAILVREKAFLPGRDLGKKRFIKRRRK